MRTHNICFRGVKKEKKYRYLAFEERSLYGSVGPAKGKYLEDKFCCFCTKTYFVGTYSNCLAKGFQ